MPGATNFRLRRVWVRRSICGWASASPFCWSPISVSGAALVWHDHLDALVNPGRYAATAGQSLPPSQLIARATAALDRGFQPVVLRMPEGEGWPATVSAREGRRGEGGGRPRLVTVYLDPPTGRVLDTAEFRDTLIGFLHRFHESLTVPEYSGRAIVGWAGAGMLILALSGIYCVVAAQWRLPARPALDTRTDAISQPASSARILDFDTARRRVGDRYLSRLSAAVA